VVLQISVSTEGENTLLNLEVKHNDPTSSHYVDIIEVEIDGNIQRETGLTPQNTTQFTYQYDLGEVEYENVRVRVHCNLHGWSSWATLGEQPQEGCLIATATYESELSPQVQFLRGFRDNYVLSTFAGNNFMIAFNKFYYSFSPSVASVITDNSALKDIMKVILYPLLGILQISSTVFSVFSVLPELGVIAAGFIASSLLGIIYILPLALLVGLKKKVQVSIKIVRLLGLILISSVLLLFLAEIFKSPTMMIMSTSVFVLVTITTTTLYSLRIVSKRLIH
jgi:peptide/nickel transport system substrate-binding protein